MLASNSFGVTTSAVAKVTGRALVTLSTSTSGKAYPPIPDSAKAIAASGDDYYVATPEGRVLKWNDWTVNSPAYLPGFTNVAAMSARWDYVLALLEDGTVMEHWTNPRVERAPYGLSNVVAVAAGADHSLALLEDGTVRAWGTNQFGPSQPPAGLGGVISIASGPYHSLALLTNGSVVGWGRNWNGECGSPRTDRRLVGISAGEYYSVGLLEDGRVLAWGNVGQRQLPASATNIVSIAAAGSDFMALRADGMLFSSAIRWGDVPGIAAVSASGSEAIALTMEGLGAPPFGIGQPRLDRHALTAPVPTQRGSTYYLRHTSNLGTSWIMEPPVPGNGSVKILRHQTEDPSQHFYRVYRKPGT